MINNVFWLLQSQPVFDVKEKWRIFASACIQLCFFFQNFTFLLLLLFSFKDPPFVCWLSLVKPYLIANMGSTNGSPVNGDRASDERLRKDAHRDRRDGEGEFKDLRYVKRIRWAKMDRGVAGSVWLSNMKVKVGRCWAKAGAGCY